MPLLPLVVLCGIGIYAVFSHRVQPTTLPSVSSIAAQSAQSPVTSQADAISSSSVEPARELLAAKIEVEKRAALYTGSPLPPDFLDAQVAENEFRFTLPDAAPFRGEITASKSDENGLRIVEGRVISPYPGKFYIQRQTSAGVSGPFVGNIRFDGKTTAWVIRPTADATQARFVPCTLDDVMCVNFSRDPIDSAGGESEPEEAPQTHPFPIPLPPGITIVPLQSLPGARAVIYLDFDGEKGPFASWGDFDAAAPNVTNAQVFDVWKMVCEDFQGFTINVTTDRRVYDLAPAGRRQHCIITPTKTASPSAGGVAFRSSFNDSENRVCWAFGASGRNTAEIISHELGHTLGLAHDGRTAPVEEYYAGHGSGNTAWGPIMGVAYNIKLSHWSKGEYAAANNTQDDLLVISSSNNEVDYRADDSGSTLATSAYLEIFPNQSVANEGILGRTGDVDTFRFTTTGGDVSLTVSTVALNANLDLQAEIVDASTSAVIVTDNPAATLNATVAALLPAGEYLLRIRASGLGDPLGTGYTNYGCIGSYLVSGSVLGGIQPSRHSLAENSPVGANVGSVVARLDHGTNPLQWAISSGNSNAAFAIDPNTGAITVANAAALNFEALSLRWDDPASFELFVTITDATDPLLNETIRTVVSVTDVNEAPSATSTTITLLERLPVATTLTTITASDVDRFDILSYAITAGNADGYFAIDPTSGRITMARVVELDTDAVFTLTISVTDQGVPRLSTSATVQITLINIVNGYTPGKIVRTYFESISGGLVSNLTSNAKFPNNPDSEEFLSAFDGSDHGSTFGSTIRGFLIPPVTGNYQFWIAADDTAQLLLSTSENPANATAIATVSAWTNAYQWTKSAAQQSVQIALTAGQAYYIEARHKENSGGDHVAVAWTGPGIATRQVIPGAFLSPRYQNYAPKIVRNTVLTIREKAAVGQDLGLAPVSDVNTGETSANFAITAGDTLGIFRIDPSTGRITVAKSGLLNPRTRSSYTLTIQMTDNGIPALTGTGTLNVFVADDSTIRVGGIHQEMWTGLTGSALSGLTGNAAYPFRPTSRTDISSFTTTANVADNYGTRIRTQFIPETTGSYTFYISSDDDSRLLYSADTTGVGAATIASITGWTGPLEWTKFPSQKSATFNLVAGVPVYLEALHKENVGGDHLSVGYTGPGIAAVTVIPGQLIDPIDINTAPTFSAASYTFTLSSATPATNAAVGTVAATDPNAEPLVYEITAGNAAAAFDIHSTTGAITVVNPAALRVGNTVLTVIAQDTGLQAIYPYKNATTTVTVRVPNIAPIFTANPITLPDIVDGTSLSSSLASFATDADVTANRDTLTFTKTAGPAWLNVASNGDLTGTPLPENVGTNTFTIRATDAAGAFAQATLSIVILSSFPDLNANAILDTWETTMFGNATSGANMPTENHDGDVHNNLLEFALGSNPTLTNASPIFSALTDIDTEKYLTLTVPKNPLATNLAYIVEVSSSPAGPWLSAHATDTAIITDTSTQLIVRDRTPVSAAARRFIRLRIHTVPR